MVNYGAMRRRIFICNVFSFVSDNYSGWNTEHGYTKNLFGKDQTHFIYEFLVYFIVYQKRQTGTIFEAFKPKIL